MPASRPEVFAVSPTAADLPAFLRDADRGVKDAALAALVAERMATHPGTPLDVPGVGVVVLRPSAAGLVNPFLWDEREEALLRERLATIDDTVSGEELSRRVAEAVRARLATR